MIIQLLYLKQMINIFDSNQNKNKKMTKKYLIIFS